MVRPMVCSVAATDASASLAGARLLILSRDGRAGDTGRAKAGLPTARLNNATQTLMGRIEPQEEKDFRT